MRTLDELADAYPNPQHLQQRVFAALLEAIESGDSDDAAQAAAQLALQIEQQGVDITTQADEHDRFGDDS